MEQNEKKSLGYRIGELFALTIAGCVATVIIASTIKLITLMLF